MSTPPALRGRLVLPDEVVPDGVVEVAGDRLGYVGPADGWTGATPEPVGTVVPGLVDMHCHGGGGASVTTGVVDDVVAVGEHHLARGTTTMLASLVTAEPAEVEAAVRAVARVVAEVDGPVIGSHLEGPFIAPGHCGAHTPSLLRHPDAVLARAWVAAGGGTVRMLTLAPELPGADAVVDLLDDAGVLVAVGHTDADAGAFATALRRDAVRHVTHLFNAMAPMHHREPGPVAASLAALVRGQASVELIADGVHLADDTVAMVFALDAGRHRIALVSDAMAAAGMADGHYRLGPLEVEVRDGVARTTGPEGSIAGSTVHVADALRRCVVHAGVDPVAAVRAATATPAGLLGLTDRGRLAPGLRADLVTLDDDWTVTGVLRAGRRVR